MTHYAAVGPFCRISICLASSRLCQQQASGVIVNRKAPFYWHNTSEFHGPSVSRYSDSLLAGRSGDRIPVGVEVFRTRPDWSWGPPSLLYNAEEVFPGCKEAGVWRWPPTPSSAEVKERVELYLYSPFGPSWPVLGWPLPLPSVFLQHYLHSFIVRLSTIFVRFFICTKWTRMRLASFVALHQHRYCRNVTSMLTSVCLPHLSTAE